MEELLDYARSVLADQPFSRMLGAELVAFTPGNAELALVINDELKQQHGFVHGGVVSYLADNALTFAGGSLLGDSVTLEMKINYLRPAVGDRLVATAKVVSSTKRFAICECRVWASSPDKTVLAAMALGTISKVDDRA